MSSIPTQTLIVRLPAEKARRIARIVESSDSGYGSVDEFIRVAVENQLTMESDASGLDTPRTPDPGPGPSPGAARHESGAPSGAAATGLALPKPPPPAPTPRESAPLGRASEELLHRPDAAGLPLRAPTPTSDQPLSSFTNRLTPMIAGPRVLANLSKNGRSPSVIQFLDLTAKASRALGLRLRMEDDAANRRGRHRRSTAWPVGDDEGKSLIRYRTCFMFAPAKNGGFTGPLLDLRLVAVVDGNVFLTESGSALATALSPAIDEAGSLELLSGDHRKVLVDAILHLPGEFVEVQQFLAAVESTSGSQDAIDKVLGEIHSGWSEAQVVSHRAALVGRLRDLTVIDIATDPKTVIVPGAGHASFMELLSAAASPIEHGASS